MKNQLVKINPEEFGLQAIEASQVEAVFKPMLEKMSELETEFNEVMTLPIEPTTIKLAKELRLKYVKIRTATADIHKQAKAYYLAGGRFVDGWKNAQLMASQGKEEALEKIEKHFENIEKERKEKLRAERWEKLQPYIEIEPFGLGEMTETVWAALFNGTVSNHDTKIEAERKAEEERIAKEKEEAEERERIRLENERLKKEAEAKEKQLAEERAKAEAERKAIEEKARKEREEADRKLKAEQEAAKLAAEKAAAEKAKLEAEIKAKAEAEEKAKKEAEAKAIAEQKAKEAAERKAKNAPDKEKLLLFAKQLESLVTPELTSSEALSVLANTKTLIQKTVDYICKESEKL